MKHVLKYVSFVFIMFMLLAGTSCSSKPGVAEPSEPSPYLDGGGFTGVPRLLIKGTVKNMNDEPVSGIRIEVYGVREKDEPDVLYYNYTFTDSIGQFIISRYLGRNMEQEVTVIASDPKMQYKEMVQFAPIKQQIVWDTYQEMGGESTSLIVEIICDFVLEEEQ